MTDAAVAPLARAQKLAETASWLALAAIVMIVLSTLNELSLGQALEKAREGASDSVFTLIKTVARNSILAAPAWLLVGALFDLRVALREYENGRFFSVKSSAAVRSAGEWTLYALGAKIIGAPTLYAWVSGQPGGFHFNYESFDLGLVAIAAFVMMIGRVLEAAAALKAENDEIV
jgi:Protein of unknown function (DUF2975)